MHGGSDTPPPHRVMLYAAKCYWPGITQDELARVGASATRESEKVSRRTGKPVMYRGSLLFPNDELVLCLFAADTSAAIRETTEDAGIPCERLMQTLWMPNPNTVGDEDRATRTSARKEEA